MVGVFVSDVDESQEPGEAPADYVRRLSEAKARAAVANARAEHIIVAADTAVVDGDVILGKPKDMNAAVEMLQRLRGHTHQVFTGLTIINVKDGRSITEVCVTDVPMRNYSDDEINAYVLTGDPLDKAGAYAIQHPRFQPVENMQGCFASVMGLPLCHLTRALRKMDITPNADIPNNCQTYLHYQCPVSRSILRGEQAG